MIAPPEAAHSVQRIERELLALSDGNPGETLRFARTPVLEGEIIEVREWTGRGETWRSGNEGIVGVVFKSPAAEGLIAASPDRFYKAAYLHHRGWVGLRLDGPVDWTEVADFVTDSYLAVAPKRLAAQVEP